MGRDFVRGAAQFGLGFAGVSEIAPCPKIEKNFRGRLFHRIAVVGTTVATHSRAATNCRFRPFYRKSAVCESRKFSCMMTEQLQFDDRAALLAEIKRQIVAGTYDTPWRLSLAVDGLLDDLERGSQDAPETDDGPSRPRQPR